MHLLVSRPRPGILPRIEQHRIESEIEADQQRRNEDRGRQHHPHGPQERHTAQIADQKRRAHGRQAAADIADEQDQKQEAMRLVAAPPVGPQQHRQEQKGRPRRTDNSTRHCPQRQQDRILARMARHPRADMDAAGNDVKRGDRDDEGQIFEQEQLLQRHQPCLAEYRDRSGSAADAAHNPVSLP